MEVDQEKKRVQGGGAGEAEYQRLKAEHTLLDEKIRDMEEERLLSAEQEMEVKTLKKRKLALKDQMERFLHGG